MVRRSLAVCAVAWLLTGCSSEALIPWQPNHPARVSAITGQHSVTLQWDAVPEAASYNVYGSSAPDVSVDTYEILIEGASSPAEITDLPSGAPLYFVVTAVLDTEYSSATVSATPMGTGWDSIAPDATPVWFVEGDQTSSSFGDAAYPAGDVNGDGYEDVIVGSSSYDDGQDDEGALFLYYGGPNGLSKEPDWVGESNQAGAHLGHRVESAGDVNGDGYGDVITGAQTWGNGQANEGAAFVYFGSETGFGDGPDWSWETDQAGAQAGRSTDAAGDVNGDGYDDIIVGALSWDETTGDEGAVFLFYGGPDGPSATPDWHAAGDPASNFGWSVAAAGDVNGDGYADIIVGAHGWDSATDQNVGRVYLYFGGPDGPAATADWFVEGDQPGSGFGYPVTGSGADANADGYDDILFGWKGWDSASTTDLGRVQVYYGGPDGPATTPDWTATGTQADSGMGERAWLGDINFDGYADVITGSDGFKNDTGQVSIWYGSETGLATEAGWTGEGLAESTRFGASVSCSDVNGDGGGDLVIGAPSWDGTAGDGSGGAWLFYGPPSAGPRVITTSRSIVRAGEAFTPVGADIEDTAASSRVCEWDWGDETPATVLNSCTPDNVAVVDHIYAAPGRYTVTLTVSNSFGVGGQAASIIDVQ